MKLWLQLLSLVVFVYSSFANAWWFTSDESNFQECMENRRSDIMSGADKAWKDLQEATDRARSHFEKK